MTVESGTKEKQERPGGYGPSPDRGEGLTPTGTLSTAIARIFRRQGNLQWEWVAMPAGSEPHITEWLAAEAHGFVLTATRGHVAKRISAAARTTVTALGRVLREPKPGCVGGYAPKSTNGAAIAVLDAQSLEPDLAADLLAAGGPILLISTETPEPRSFLAGRTPYGQGNAGQAKRSVQVPNGALAIIVGIDGSRELLCVLDIDEAALKRGQRFALEQPDEKKKSAEVKEATAA